MRTFMQNRKRQIFRNFDMMRSDGSNTKTRTPVSSVGNACLDQSGISTEA